MKRKYIFKSPVPEDVWVFQDDSKPTMIKKQRAVKKAMHAVFFGSTGLVKPSRGQKTVKTNWYFAKCLQEIFQEANVRGLTFFTRITPLKTHKTKC